jgi:hypothetical protein
VDICSIPHRPSPIPAALASAVMSTTTDEEPPLHILRGSLARISIVLSYTPSMEGAAPRLVACSGKCTPPPLQQEAARRIGFITGHAAVGLPACPGQQAHAEVWDSATGAHLGILTVTGTEGSAAKLSCLAVYYAGEGGAARIIGGDGEGGALVVWDGDGLGLVQAATAHAGGVTCLHVYDDAEGARLVSGGEDGEIKVGGWVMLCGDEWAASR